MFSFSPLYRDKVYACATDALCGALKEAGNDGQSKAGQDLQAIVVAVAAAIQTAANESCADFLERFNEMHPDPLRRLPAEVLQECFRSLHVEERIAVSQVSRAWRRIAIADRRLWTEPCIIGHQRSNATKLSVFLSRSSPLPFRLTWYTSGSRDDAVPHITQILAQHMSRIQYIFFEDVPDDALIEIFDRPAPLLQHLTIHHSFFCFPGNWSEYARRLESLDITEFAIPREVGPLPSVRKFRGGVYQAEVIGASSGDGLSRLFEVLPCLVSLELHGLSDETLSLLPGVPPTVTDLVLWAGDDFSAFLMNRTGDASMNFIGHDALGIPNTIRVFATKVSGTWSLTVSPSGIVTLEAPDSSMMYELHCKHSAWWDAHYHPFLRSLDRLASLTIPMSDLVNLCADTLVWDRALPSLRHLALTTYRNADLRSVQPEHLTHHSPIHAAQLTTLTVEGGLPLEATYIATTLPTAITLLLPRLDFMRMELNHAERLRNQEVDLRGLTRLARRVQITDRHTRDVIVDLVDGDVPPRES